MRLMTWNINSVRLRQDLVVRAIEALAPDIVALQELKCETEQFPRKAFEAVGFVHQAVEGMKSYNGVAILSRWPIDAVSVYGRAGKGDARHIAVTLTPPAAQAPVTVHNLYIPAGGDIPDVAINDKFAHKLDFYRDIASFFEDEPHRRGRQIVVGDFNVAPLEHDVWSHRQLLDVVSHTPVEVAHLEAFQGGLGWVDAVRHFVPSDRKCYTWWSYRNQDWRKSNRGRRLDHIWVTPDLVPALATHEILIEARDWPQPSDHVPVLVSLDINRF